MKYVRSLHLVKRACGLRKAFGAFMIDLDKALTFPNEAHVDNLASQIEKIDMLDRWIQDIV